MSDDQWLQQINSQTQLSTVMKLNEYTKQFGVTLSEQEAQLILREKNATLKEQQRVEFGESIIPRLIQEFCDSPYIDQDNYVESIVRLQEIFYLYKNESMDRLTDDELIAYMRKAFDGCCQGSLDYLEETILEKLARDARRDSDRMFRHYLNQEDEEEEDDWDE